MLFDHDARQRLDVEFVSADVVSIGDGEFGLDVVFEVEAADWDAVQERFDSAGVAGGFSFTATVPQAPPKSGQPPRAVIAADAAAWTDEDRVAAQALLDQVVPTQADQLFQYSAAVDVASVFLVLAQGVGLGVLGNAAYDAIKGLVGKAKAATTRVEIHRTAPDGSELKAIVTTSDPELARLAIQTLPETQASPTLDYMVVERRWVEAGPTAPSDADAQDSEAPGH